MFDEDIFLFTVDVAHFSHILSVYDVFSCHFVCFLASSVSRDLYSDDQDGGK